MTTTRRSGVPARALAATVALVIAAAACSSDDSSPAATGGSTSRSAPATATATAPGETDATTTDSVGATTADTTDGADDTVATTASSTTTIGTVPDEGVPGIDSDDAFCRSWSEFAGSFQALSVATAFGLDPSAPARLEVVAAPAVVAAVDALGEHLPAELEPEREDFVDGLAGPLARRAERARSELVAAGLGEAAIAELGRAWLETLAETGLDDPGISVEVPGSVDAAAVEAAADAFREAAPPINQDPSLITNAQTPATDRYLAENCPDQGTLGGNDVIDEF